MTRLLGIAVVLALLALPTAVSAECITLTWTASGDDGYVGQASFYDIRYSKTFITEQTWAGNSRVTRLPVPRISGGSEQFTVCGLEPQQAYYFAIKAGDEHFNWSPLSNVVLKITAGELSGRGDVNANDIPYEVGDAVNFTNYFTQGLAAFEIDLPRQIEATDVNADGLPLSVADLTYLIRVVVGDAQALLKPNPLSDELRVRSRRSGGAVEITSEAPVPVGSAFFTWDIEGDVQIGQPELLPASEGMSVVHSVRDGKLRLLLFDIGTDRVPHGIHDIVRIPCSGSGTVHLLEVQATDYDGSPFVVSRAGGALPEQFELYQNYPNPFNPTTEIQFSLPVAARVSLTVYNVLGEQVRLLHDGELESGTHSITWDGRSDAGTAVSSGVYLYRLASGDFSDSRKMLLIK